MVSKPTPRLLVLRAFPPTMRRTKGDNRTRGATGDSEGGDELVEKVGAVMDQFKSLLPISRLESSRDEAVQVGPGYGEPSEELSRLSEMDDEEVDDLEPNPPR